MNRKLKIKEVLWQYRPRRILAKFFDPFDDQELSSLDAPYNPRLAADGHYSKRIRKLIDLHRRFDAKILHGRTPRVNITFLY